MHLRHWILTVPLFFLAAGMASAYEASTHLILSRAAAQASIASVDPAVFADLGLAPVATQSFAGAAGFTGTFPSLVAFGSSWEDLAYLVRPLNHFFDPQYNAYAGRGLDYFVSGHPSPDWALEDRGELLDRYESGNPAQVYSFRQAQQGLYAGLTGQAPAARLQAFAGAFQSLGHVIHHLQDMAQPQHTRNDAHPPGDRRATFYESYTRSHLDARLAGLLAAAPWAVPTLPTARHFWITPGARASGFTGMAEFSAHNFVSARTTYRSRGNEILPAEGFPLPNGFNRDGTQKRVARESRSVVLAGGKRYEGNIDFVRGTVFDGWVPSTTRPPLRLAALSVLDPPLRFLGFSRNFAENSAVFEDAYPVLMPRAAAFSTGLINHFFRGRLDFRRLEGNQWTLENRSGTRINGVWVGQEIQGIATLHQQDGSGERRPVPGASWNIALSYGQSINVTLPELPAATRHLVIAFRGRIGQEGDPTGASGYYAVAGKVVSYTPPPVACAGLRTAEGGSAGLDVVHELGSTKGTVPLEFEAYQIPDKLEVRAENAARTLLATTSSLVSGFRSWNINGYDPAALGATRVRLQVTGNTDPATAWNLSMACPGQTLSNATRRAPRVSVTMRWGTVLQGAIGSCAADVYVDGQFIGRMAVSATGGGARHVLTLSKGAGHGYEYRNHSCQAGTRDLLTSGSYSDPGGTWPLESLSRTGVRYFEVH